MKSVPKGHQFVMFHMVFDVKWRFLCKPMLVASYNMTEALSIIICENMVSCETVRIALMYVVLNDVNKGN